MRSSGWPRRVPGLILLLGLAVGGCRGPGPGPSAQGSGAEGPPAPSGARVVPSEGLEADLVAVEAFFDTRPRVERPIRTTGLDGVQGVGALSAEACRACHPAIYDEWRSSIHSQAWIDPQLQGELEKSDNRWLCLSCHTPLLVQHDRWPRGLVDGDVERPIVSANPRFDPALREEGITCTACHLLGDRIGGPGIAQGQAPHPVAVDPRFRSGELCLSCHQASAIYEGKSFICVFDTGREWREGPYDDEGQTCVDCHMPPIERPVGLTGPPRQVRRHWWRGAGIPKIEGRYPPAEANVPGLGLSAEAQGAALSLTLSNANAGHLLPTGDPERWIQIDVTFTDASGGTVGSPFQHRIGQIWEWSTPPRKRSDNRLAPREVRRLSVAIPAGASQASIEASSHRISEDNAGYHGLDGYPRSVGTHHLEVALSPP
ncbi:MAG TPA: hypothetical protein ENK18_18225 [Deltaproteobacteria bacterium]|nr:hypothetical protein [Deltaproteobacteria bacterium]